jgi:hypothetical protein
MLGARNEPLLTPNSSEAVPYDGAEPWPRPQRHLTRGVGGRVLTGMQLISC